LWHIVDKDFQLTNPGDSYFYGLELAGEKLGYACSMLGKCKKHIPLNGA